MTIGPPIPVDSLFAEAGGDRRVMVDAVGLAVADLLPLPWRGFYRDGDSFPEAREALRQSRRAHA